MESNLESRSTVLGLKLVQLRLALAQCKLEDNFVELGRVVSNTRTNLLFVARTSALEEKASLYPGSDILIVMLPLAEGTLCTRHGLTPYLDMNSLCLGRQLLQVDIGGVSRPCDFCMNI